MSPIHGWICGPRLYRYKGREFECSPIMGPWPVKKNGDPYARAGRRWYAFIAPWITMSKSQQERFRIGGGCREF